MTDMNKYGLSERDMQTISNILRKYMAVEKAFIFGSRAKGTYHAGSDIDIAIMARNVQNQTLRNIKSDLSDSSLPYNVDLVDFSTLKNRELKEYIIQVGKPLFSE